MLRKKDLKIIGSMIDKGTRSRMGVVQPFLHREQNNTRSLMRMQVLCDKIGTDKNSMIGVGTTVAGE